MTKEQPVTLNIKWKKLIPLAVGLLIGGISTLLLFK